MLQHLLAHWPEHPNVALVTTDGFLHPNAELERRGLLQRKGFPESYDRRALLRFVVDIKSGKDEVEAPVYDHLTYDVVPDEKVRIKHPDIVIIEGLNVLQPARVRDDGRTGLAVSDFFDFSVYVDAGTTHIRDWYVSRFLRLRETAFRDPQSYFARYASLSRDEATAEARRIWDTHQRPQPRPERAAHPLPRHPRAPQGRRPLGPLRAAAQDLTQARIRSPIGLEAAPDAHRPSTFCSSSTARPRGSRAASLIAFIGALTSALPVTIHSTCGNRSTSARWLASLTASPSRWPRCAGSTSVPPWKRAVRHGAR